MEPEQILNFQGGSYWKDVYLQTLALLKKNCILAQRNKTSSFLRIFSPVFFILLIFLVNEGLKARFAIETFFRDLPNPTSEQIQAIPSCTPMYGMSDCVTFVYTPAPNDSFVPETDYKSLEDFAVVAQCLSSNSSCAEMYRIHKIVRGMMKYNGLSAVTNVSQNAIPSSKVLGFRTPMSMDDFLSKRPEYVQGGYIFSSASENDTTFVIQQNSTISQIRGEYQQPYLLYTLPMQQQAYREILRQFNATFELDIYLKEFAHPPLAVATFEGVIAPLFLIGGAVQPYFRT